MDYLNKNPGRISNKLKSIILSVIAIIEILVIITTMTLAWFEGQTSLIIEGENIKTDSALKSEFIVGEGTNYSATAELNQFFHAQSKAKFSPVSSFNGEDFYALYEGTANNYDDYNAGIANGSLKFRKLSEEEKNSSIVYFQFKVTSQSSATDFWLKEMPTIKVGGTTLGNENNPFRIRISDGTATTTSTEGDLILTTKTAWPGGSRANMKAIKSLTSTDTATLNTGSGTGNVLGNRAIYKVFDGRPCDTNGYLVDGDGKFIDANGNVVSTGTVQNLNKNGSEILFKVGKGETKTITVAIWLEALDQSYSTDLISPGADVDINLTFCSSWDVVDHVVFRDYTADQWIDNIDAKQNNAAQRLGLANLDSSSNYYYPFAYDSDNHQWTANIPRAVQNVKFIWQGVSDTTEDATWTPIKREKNTVFTAFGSTACFWYAGEVTKISFADYTGNHWVNNNIDGSAPKMKIQIIYSGNSLNYSMSESPIPDAVNRNTWYAYIPSSVDAVLFNRYSASDLNTPKHTWNGTDRIVQKTEGSTTTTIKHTDYYALDGVVEDVESNIQPIYLTIRQDETNYFYYGDYPPAISITSDENVDTIEALRASGNANLANLGKEAYYTQGPHADTWPGDDTGKLTKVNDYVYAFYFDKDYLEQEADANGDIYFSFWCRNQSGHNNIDNDVRFAAAIKFNIYDTTKNNYTLVQKYQLKAQQFNGAYIWTGNWNAYTGSDPNLTTQGETVNGQWGPPDLPEGTYETYFVHNTNVSTVTASFEYYGKTHTVNMTKGSDGLTWTYSGTGIPDDVTTVTFTDNTGKTWTNQEGRSKSTPYYYVTGTSTGKWSAKITPPSGQYKTYFVPYGTGTLNSVTATYTYEGVQFSVDLIKDSTTAYWYTQAIPDAVTTITFKTSAGNTYSNTTGRSSNANYYITSSTSAGTWGKPAVPTKTIYLNANIWEEADAWFWVHAWGGSEEADVKMTAVSGQSGVYSAEIPEDSTSVIFCRMNPAYSDISWDKNNKKLWNQTVDLTIPNDSDTFTVTDWSTGTDGNSEGTWYEVEEPEPVANMLYLKPNSNWTQAGARFAAYFFNDSAGIQLWVDMTDSDNDGIYEVEIPDTGSTTVKVIFCRMNPSTTANNWNNGVKWNQTGNLTIPTNGNNLYTVASGTWDNGGGTWSTKS